jgi:NAD(P)H-nitrite reductase large subunit
MLKEDARYITKCGTNCGKCIPYIQQNLIPGTEDAIYSEEELLLAYKNAQLGGMG